jgi:DNA-binding beta-propeller fold protein YncE
VYIDPKTREIYVMNNDTQEYIPVFGPDQKGNSPPERYLEGVRGFGIAADEERGLLYLTNQNGTISVYPKNYTTDTKPIRKIEGNNTSLEDPHGIALDTKNKLIYVSNFGNVNIRAEGGRYGKFDEPSITMYPLDGQGDIKPVRKIQGPKTLMNWPSHIALHVGRQELFVANDADSSILIFNAQAEGDAAPVRVIKGPKTGIKHPPGERIRHRLSGNRKWRRRTHTHGSGRAGRQRRTEHRESRSGRVRHQARSDSGAELSGPSADCDIRQVGGQGTTPYSSNLWADKPPLAHDA